MTATAREQRTWRALDAQAARELVDARLQLHHAAQLATALGISYLQPRPDDSHTNLEWIEPIGALASNPAGDPPIRLAVRPHRFALLVVDAANTVLASDSLDGRTIDDAVRWVREQLASRSFDAAHYTLGRHFEIPAHRVARGARFDAKPALLEQLAHWYSDASLVLDQIAAATPNASPVRCWPHHFDIATLLEPEAGKTIGLGMEPGDDYWPEPYFYANMYPSPGADAARPALAGNGVWNTRDWIGAVLPASRLTNTNQRAQAEEFVASAVRACTRMLGGR